MYADQSNCSLWLFHHQHEVSPLLYSSEERGDTTQSGSLAVVSFYGYTDILALMIGSTEWCTTVQAP